MKTGELPIAHVLAGFVHLVEPKKRKQYDIDQAVRLLSYSLGDSWARSCSDCEPWYDSNRDITSVMAFAMTHGASRLGPAIQRFCSHDMIRKYCLLEKDKQKYYMAMFELTEFLFYTQCLTLDANEAMTPKTLIWTYVLPSFYANK